MEHPGTPLDQSSGTVSCRVMFQIKHFRGRQARKHPHLHVHDPSLSIKGGLTRQASTSFACMEIPLKALSRRTEFVQAMQGLAALSFGSDDSRFARISFLN
jgi:hypothetical protein